MNQPDDQTAPVPTLWKPTLVQGLLASLVGAGVSFAIVNQIHPVIPFEDLPELGPYPSADLLAKYKAAEYVFQSVNGAINCAVLGACVGLLIGALTTTKRALGAIVGLVVGASCGAIGGYVSGNLVAGNIYQAGQQSLLQSVLFMTIAWGLIAAGLFGAMAAIHHRSQILTGVIFGLIVAAAAALLYNVAASILFPMSNLILITPKTTSERLVWTLSFAVVLGIGLGLGFRSSNPPPPKPVVDVA